MNSSNALIPNNGNKYNLTSNEQYKCDKINNKRKALKNVSIVTKPGTSFLKRALVKTGVFLFPILPKSLQYRIVKYIDIIKYQATGKSKCLIGVINNKHGSDPDNEPFKARRLPHLKIIALSIKSLLKCDMTFEDVTDFIDGGICCSHLVEAYNNFKLACGKDKFNDISTTKKLSAYFKSYDEIASNTSDEGKSLSIPSDLELTKESFQESMYTLINDFFKQDKDITVSYNWLVRGHIMGLRVMKKGDKVVATMYDPVNSVDHSRFVFTNAEAAKQLTIKDFVPSRLLRKIYDIDNRSGLFYCNSKHQNVE